MEFAASTSKVPRKYDVLINFSGDDIQRKFVSHLDSALCAVGFTTFLHHENAVKSMHIQQPILNICRVAIVVFTKRYSESAWCLNQLQQIIQCHQTYGRHVLMYFFRRVLLEKPSKQLHTKHSQDNNWRMPCPDGVKHSLKLQISLDGMRAITGKSLIQWAYFKLVI